MPFNPNLRCYYEDLGFCPYLGVCTCGVYTPAVHLWISSCCGASHVLLVYVHRGVSVSLSFRVLAFISLSLPFFLYFSITPPPIICLSSSLLYNWSHINPNCIFYYELHTIYSLTCSIPNLKCKGTKCSMASSKSLSLLLPLAFDLINVFIFIKLDTDIILKIKHLKINPERKTIPPHYTLDLHLRFIFKSFGRSFWYIPPVLKQHAYVSFS